MNNNTNTPQSDVVVVERAEKFSTSDNRIVATYPGLPDNKQINYNKPWRQIIRRVVSDGGSNHEDLS